MHRITPDISLRATHHTTRRKKCITPIHPLMHQIADDITTDVSLRFPRLCVLLILRDLIFLFLESLGSQVKKSPMVYCCFIALKAIHLMQMCPYSISQESLGIHFFDFLGCNEEECNSLQELTSEIHNIHFIETW